ncbi:MAG TPA: hypothetical protein VGN10_03465 [Pyrinomonadaceae bacterium]|jgi:hypothetical protein
MQEDPITDETDDYRPQLLMDEEDWQVAFEPYEGRPSDALYLGCKLGMLRAYLDAQTIQCRQAIKALDLAMQVLFPFTSFHDASFDLFIKYTHTGLSFEEEQMVRALGVKF